MSKLWAIVGLVALQMSGGTQPKIVEKAVSKLGNYQKDGFTCINCTVETCEDAKRVLLHRENGEAICVDFDAIEQHVVLMITPSSEPHIVPLTYYCEDGEHCVPVKGKP